MIQSASKLLVHDLKWRHRLHKFVLMIFPSKEVRVLCVSLNRSAAASASALDGLDSYEALEGAYISGRSDSQSLVGTNLKKGLCQELCGRVK